MIAASCFSGIGGAELALPEAEWLWCAEIEDFPSAVLAKRFGHPNLGDITAPDFIERARALGPLDLLCGGPPCQAFSVAGLRKGMADPRGQLSLRFIEIAHELASTNGLRNLLVENVPGWLSHEDNAFGCFLGGLVGADDALPNPIGGSWPRAGMVAGPRARAAWRVLDAQYAGLAQRRQRVFLVADFGNGADPVSVLFERKSLSGHHPPRRETGQDVAGTLSARTEGGGGLGTGFDIAGGLQPVAAEIAPTLTAAFGNKLGLENQHIDGGGDCSLPSVAMCLNAGAMGRQDAESETLIPVNRCDFDVAHTLREEGFNASEDGTGRGVPLVPILFRAICKDSFSGGMGGKPEGAAAGHFLPIAYRTSGNSGAWETGDKVDALTTGTDQNSHVVAIQAGALRENPDSGPDGVGVQSDIAYTIEARAEVQAVAFDLRGREGGAQFEGPHDTANIRAASGGSSRSYVAESWAVRRLSVTECERLQGYPDGHTLIEVNKRRTVVEDEARYLLAKGAHVALDNQGRWRTNAAADGPRYKALGNAWAVACVRPIALGIMRGLAA